jgi:ABC-type Mn2+/Zn2+ transport system ATPase subunit
MALLAFKDVTLGYGRRPVLEGLSFEIQEGEFLGIVGPNGSGKTTVLRAILGLLKPRAGSIRLERKTRFGYVPQRESVNDLFPVTVLDIVMMGRYPLKRKPAENREAARGCLRSVGIEDLSDASYRTLSGGQKQRTLIARALAAEPDILVLDEPTNGMDLASEHAIMQLVRELHREGGRTVLMVTHMLNLVANYVERIALLDGGFQIGPAASVLSEENLTRLYGVGVRVREVDGQRVVLR